ncbi:MAG: hypothetical protein ACOYB0_08315 [Polynucleobacter sp.]
MTMPKTPSADDLHIAAQWLDIYEGAEDREACQRVRVWLLEQSDALEFRQACREAGVTVAQARRAIKAKAKPT